MSTQEQRPPRWGTRPFAEVVNDMWAKHENRRRARYSSLYRTIAEAAEIGYEWFRRMCDGTAAPRMDVMEQVAAVLQIDPREFPEYRLQQMKDACSRYPELERAYYDELMAYAATIERAAAQEGRVEQKEE